MKGLLTYAILLSSLLSSTGCKDNNTLSGSQKILFQYSFTCAPGTQRNEGVIIDSQGNVLLFSNPSGWNVPDRNAMLSNNQVEENLAQCRFSGMKIPVSELTRFSGYINNIFSSKVSAGKKVSQGRGTYGYYCYYFSAADSTYRQVIIRMHGDTDCENLNFYSRKVVDWINLLIRDLPVQQP